MTNSDVEDMLASLTPDMKLRMLKQSIDIVGLTVDANRERYGILYAQRYGHSVEKSHAAVMLALEVLGVLYTDVADQL